MKKRPEFYVLYRDFNTGNMEKYDVLDYLFKTILTDKDKIKKYSLTIYDDDMIKIPVTTKEHLQEFINDHFRYFYWAKCEWEFITVDWPYRTYDDITYTDMNGDIKTTKNGGFIDDNRPVKIDVYDQLEPNIPVITDIVWNYIEPLMNK